MRILKKLAAMLWGAIVAVARFIAGILLPPLEMIRQFVVAADRLFATVTEPANKGTARFLAWLTKSRFYSGPVGVLYELFVAIWICRVSLISVALGFLLLWYSPQARDLLLDVRSQTTAPVSFALGSISGDFDLGSITAEFFHAITLGAAVLLLWALPVQVCARWSLAGRARPPETELGRLTGVDTWPDQLPGPFIRKLVPVLLGISCFAAMFVAINRLELGLTGKQLNFSAGFGQRQTAFLTVAMIIFTVLYLVAVLRSLVEASDAARGRVATAPAGTFSKILFLLEEIFYRYAGLTALVGTGLLIWFVITPQLSSEWSRALVLPLLLGAVIPFFSLLAWLSAVIRLPLLLLLVVVVVVLRACVHEGHDVRILPAPASPSDPRALSFSEAVRLWRTHNQCDADPRQCPKPILVAAAGGASRAAFMTTSTLGLFLDATCTDQDDKTATLKECRSTPAFANRLFAISGVSGGALGGALTTALLREHQDRQPSAAELRPCRADVTPSGQWFHRGNAIGWRQCLQMILAEDFLSPVVIGLAFRDQIPLIGLWARDRAALLEDSWDDAFSRYASLAPPAGRMALSAPFERLAPSDRHWRPMLVLNGTSVSTGRRILTSHLKPFHDGGCLFKDAYDFHGMISVAAQLRVDWVCGLPAAVDERRTISIATAISNSARFPIISPPGTVRGSDGRLYVDRIVDGGYFENYGVTTAYDIAEALRESGLDPVVLLITNEPILPARVKELNLGATIMPPLPEGSEILPLAWARAPVGAFLETRSSRGDLSLIRLTTLLAGPRPDDGVGRLAHVSVYPEFLDGADSTAKPRFKDVSMSWWLSKPIQEYLNDQLFQTYLASGQQQQMLLRVCDWLGHPGKRELDLRKTCRERLIAQFLGPTSTYLGEGARP